MNITKQELIIRECMDALDIIEKQYIELPYGNDITEEKYIANLMDCVIVKSNDVMWAVLHVGTFDRELFDKVKKDSRTYSFSELYDKYNSVVKLNAITSFHTSRVTIERETE